MIQSRPVTDRAEWLGWRKRNVNASEVAALFGPKVRPGLTPLKLWALKTGKIEDDADNPAMRRGRLFEPVVIEILKEDHPDWQINKTLGYYWDDETRLGATPDVDATRPDIAGDGVIQVKTVGAFAFKRHWHDETGNVAVPSWIAVQASVEAFLTGATWAGVAALKLGDGGIEIAYIDIPLKMHLIRTIEQMVADFWQRVAEDRPYPPDFGLDRNVILDLYDTGWNARLDFSNDAEFRAMLLRRDGLKGIIKAGKDATDERKEIDVRIIHRLGNASAAICGKKTVTVRVIKRKGYEVKPTQWPMVNIMGNEEEGVEEDE